MHRSPGSGTWRGVLIALLALLFTLVAPLGAQDAFGRGVVELNAFGGLFLPGEPEFVAGETTYEFEKTPLFGGRLGYVAPIGLSIEGHLGYSPAEIVLENGTEVEFDVLLYGGSLGWTAQLARRAQFFVSGGAGIVRWDPGQVTVGSATITGAESDLDLHLGGGFKLYIARALAFRIEARDHLLPDGLSATRQALSGIGADESEDLTHNLGLTAGFSLFFGGPGDADGDGVEDGRDACPNTPRGIQVDSRGCPLDEDGDGVPDHRDRCAGTAAGIRVDRDGCPLDTDGDGVPDGIDRCEGTTAGVRVNESGCATDTDADGVPDGIDQCPNTPVGAQVDETGCSRDADADGVPDGIDQCPNSAPGANVDEVGCEISTVEAELIETGRIVLRDVHFDFDRATLRPESRPILNEVGEVLLRHPELRIEIQGHTDAIGPDPYNQGLSDRRARAVLEYLVTNFPGLDPDQYTTRGYGESRPVATNATDEGRQLNRRVEFVVLEGPANIQGQRREP